VADLSETCYDGDERIHVQNDVVIVNETCWHDPGNTRVQSVAVSVSEPDCDHDASILVTCGVENASEMCFHHDPRIDV